MMTISILSHGRLRIRSQAVTCQLDLFKQSTRIDDRPINLGSVPGRHSTRRMTFSTSYFVNS